MSEATDDLRKIAQKRLKKKQDFKSYLFIWFVVSLIVSGIWFLATPGEYFWPIWTIGGMGIAVPFIAWDAFGPSSSISESAIDAEIKKMGTKD
jgi:hypothetical protein